MLVNPWDTRRVTTLLYRLFRRARRANARDARTRRRKVDRVTSSSTGSAYASDSDEFDSDLDEDDSDDDSEAEDSSADEADDSDDGRQLSTVASSDAGSLLKKPNLAQGGALRSRSIRARGVERKRAHEHMLQYDLGVDATRVHLTMTWVVSFSILRPFGPLRAGTSTTSRRDPGLEDFWTNCRRPPRPKLRERYVAN